MINSGASILFMVAWWWPFNTKHKAKEDNNGIYHEVVSGTWHLEEWMPLDSNKYYIAIAKTGTTGSYLADTNITFG